METLDGKNLMGEVICKGCDGQIQPGSQMFHYGHLGPFCCDSCAQPFIRQHYAYAEALGTVESPGALLEELIKLLDKRGEMTHDGPWVCVGKLRSEEIPEHLRHVYAALMTLFK